MRMQSEEPKTEAEKKSHKIGQRHVQTLLMVFGLVSSYFLRVNISAAIVPMTKNNTSIFGEFPFEHTHPPTYDWDPSTKSLILSSFFWGYVVAQIPSGLLAKRFGAKIIFGTSMAISSIITILHPVATAAGDWQLLCALRIFTGLTQGVVHPCTHTLLAKWVPHTERGFLSTIVYSGAQLGVATILATSGSIFDAMGWPGIFYISGGFTLTWSFVFLFFGANEPAQSKYVNKVERDYIERLTGNSNVESKNLPVPWKAILTSLPFYGLIAGQCGFAWGFFTILTELPTYMSSVLQLNIKANGLLSALPYFAMWIVCLGASPIPDLLVNRRIITVTVSRKLFIGIGQWIPMVCLVALGYMTVDDKVVAIVLVTAAVGFNALSLSGHMCNLIDLTPNFAGIMMAISNCLANICSIFAPLVVGVIVKNEKNPAEWRIVFFITAGVYLFGSTFFIIFGTGTVQPWNEPPNSLKMIALNGQSGKDLSDLGSNTHTVESSVDDTKSA